MVVHKLRLKNFRLFNDVHDFFDLLPSSGLKNLLGEAERLFEFFDNTQWSVIIRLNVVKTER